MTSPFPFSSGAVLTSAQLNNIGSWEDFTPASGNWSSRSTVRLARYAQVNKLVVVKYKIELDASPTSGDGNFSIAQPAVDYNSPFTFADGDEIRFLAIYEAD